MTGEARGKFIVLEGLDGSGKTSLLGTLGAKLAELGVRYREEREPTDGALGTLARDAVKKKLCLETESLALLFAADRYEHVTGVVLPALAQGIHVLCDRFVFSNVAYQGLSMSMEEIIGYNRAAIEKCMPDLTVFVDVSPAECVRRMNASRTLRELYDEVGERLRSNYLSALELLGEKNRLLIVDGNGEPEQVWQRIWAAVEPVLLSTGACK